MADVRFAAASISDITLARDWYEGERLGLGQEFVDSIQTTAGRIGLFPNAGSVVGEGLRRQFLERFPYVLYYRADSFGVLVVACLHVARGPEYRIRRLGSQQARAADPGRAASGDRGKFERAMGKVPDVEADEGDS